MVNDKRAPICNKMGASENENGVKQLRQANYKEAYVTGKGVLAELNLE